MFSKPVISISSRVLPLALRRRVHTGVHPCLKISEEVQEAVRAKGPVVALETTIYTHGFPYPDNLALANELEDLVRSNGGVPATIGIIQGVPHIGLNQAELDALLSAPNPRKVSRRDFGRIAGLGLRNKLEYGGTTISGTMILAHLAGIKVFATGGLGGVHRGGENNLDISADLTELGRTPVAVISAGCKGFLDIPRTLEYLETQGVGVLTFADGREGDVDFPAFWARDSGIKSPAVVEDEAEAAAMIYAQNALGLQSGLFFPNPIPEAYSIPAPEMAAMIEKAIKMADTAGASGSVNTPFILTALRALSDGRTVPANRELVRSNVIRGTKVAVELSKLETATGSYSSFPSDTPSQRHGTIDELADAQVHPRATSLQDAPNARSFKELRYREVKPGATPAGHRATVQELPNTQAKPAVSHTQAELLVAGGLAIDLACDYTPRSGSPDRVLPTMSSSNPSQISQTLGGVAYNVAKAASLLGCTVRLQSVVANDLAGRVAINALNSQGMETTGVDIISSTKWKTAQYIAVNDAQGNLVVGMADMRILEDLRIKPEQVGESLALRRPKYVVIDANFSRPTLHALVSGARTAGVPVVYEPVSVYKAARIFTKDSPLSTFPAPSIQFATPNVPELASLHAAAKESGAAEGEDWWDVINAMNVPATGLRPQLESVTSAELVDQGVPQQAIQLLPFFPVLFTKLGDKGVLLTMLLIEDDIRLQEAQSAKYVMSRSHPNARRVGGLYVRLFPPPEVITDVVNVNGVGDTFLGAVMSALCAGWRIEDTIDFAQRAAALTLKSKESVAPQVENLKRLLHKTP